MFASSFASSFLSGFKTFAILDSIELMEKSFDISWRGFVKVGWNAFWILCGIAIWSTALIWGEALAIIESDVTTATAFFVIWFAIYITPN